MRALVLLTIVCASGVACADEDHPPPLGWSMGVGLSSAIVPMAVGGGVAAMNDDPGIRRGGIYTMCVGWAVAPFLSHAIAGEWKRAGIFSAVPVAAAAVAIGLLEGSRPDDLLGSGTPAPRVAFGAAMAVEAVAMGVGLIDSLMSVERWKKRHRLTVVPQLGAGRVGLNLGGTL
jgi:hypothetical protein